MKKILRFLYSRCFAAVLCILLEFAWLVAAFSLLRTHFGLVNVLGRALQAVVLVYIVNRDETPECKLLWLVLLLLLPVTGSFIFLLFSAAGVGRKDTGTSRLAEEMPRSHAAPAPEDEALRREDPGAYRQAMYLRAAADAPCHGGTDVVYFPSGEAFFAALLEALAGAERFIFMEYFLLEEGVMWDPIHDLLRRKAAEGVAVYLLYDDFGCMTTLPGDYWERLRREGIHAAPAMRLRPVFSALHNNRDHRKLTVADGRIGFAGGANLSDRYINAEEVFGRWKDAALRLEGPAVRNLTAMFIDFWRLQTGESLDPAAFLEPAPEPTGAEGWTVPFGDGPAPLYRDRVGKNVLLGILYAAADYVYITTPYLICDSELTDALRLAARRGVDVRIVTPHVPDKRTIHLLTRSHYRPLLYDGVKIYEYTPGFIHAKTIVADGRVGMCGSINLDYRSLLHNFEAGVWMYGTDCLRDMRADFLRTLTVSRRIMPEAARLTFPRRLLAELLKILSPLL